MYFILCRNCSISLTATVASSEQPKRSRASVRFSDLVNPALPQLLRPRRKPRHQQHRARQNQDHLMSDVAR